MANAVYDPKSKVDEDFEEIVSNLDGDAMEQRAIQDEVEDMTAEGGAIDAFSQESASFRDRVGAQQEANLGTMAERLSRPEATDEIKGLKLNKKNKKKGGFVKKKAAAAAGGALTGIGGTIMAIIMTLSPLQFEFLFNNIDATAFVRNNVLFDQRSSKFIQAYIAARMFEISDGDPTRDNMLFRAARVDNNNPFTDWYKTMRTSKFEANLLERHGIKFFGVAQTGADGRLLGIGGAKVEFNGEPLDWDFEGSLRESGLDVDTFKEALNNGDIDRASSYLNSLPEDRRNQLLKITPFESNRDGRRVIKNAVDNEIPWYRFIKRRTIRWNIQNMIGVKKWRFFENTRERIDNRKLRFQNKLLEKTFALTNSNGKFLGCLFGGKCIASSDPTHPDNNARNPASGGTDGSETEPDDDTNPDDDSDTRADEIDERLDNSEERGNSQNAVDDVLEEASDGFADGNGNSDSRTTKAIKKLLTSNLLKRLGIVTAVFSIVEFMDTMVSLHNFVWSGNAQKLIAVQRLASFTAVYTAFAQLKDQINSGEVNPEDASAAFESINGSEVSEAYQIMINNKPLSDAEREAACAPGQEDIRVKALEENNREEISVEPNCPEDMIGSGDSGGERLLEGYKNGLGKIVQPLAESYEKVSSIPIVGDIISGIGWLGDKLGEISSAIIQPIINGLGFGDDLERLAEWIGQQIADFFGLGPVIDGSYGPENVNASLTGATGLAEANNRKEGAAISTPETRANMDSLVAAFQDEQQRSMSVFDKYFATDNPDSLLVKLALTVPTSLDGFVDRFTNQPKNIANSLLKPTYAQNGFRISEFAGVQEYDFSARYLNSPAIKQSPEECTNAKNILGNDFELNWEMVYDSDKFWEAVHSNASGKFGDNYDEQVGRIQNICLADAAISNAFKTQYTSEDDGGITPTDFGGSSQTQNNANSGIVGDPYQDSTRVGCASGTTDVGEHDAYVRGNLVRMKLCALSNLTSTSQESQPGNQYYIEGAQGKAIVNSRVSGAWYSLVEAAKREGINLSASSTFRTMAHQTDLCNNNTNCRNGGNDWVAQPGTSSHQAGVAIDFANMSGRGGSSCASRATSSSPGWQWLVDNASEYGFKQYSREAWHWDALDAENRC